MPDDASQSVSPNQKASLELTPSDLHVLAGFSLCFVIELSMLSQAVAVDPNIESIALYHIGVVLAYLFDRTGADKPVFARGRSAQLLVIGILAALTAALGCANAVLGGSGNTPFITAAQCFGLGLLNTEVFFYWLTASRTKSASLSSFRMPAALLAGAFLFGGASYLTTEALAILMIAFPLASFALVAVPVRSGEATAATVENRPDLPPLRLSRNVSLMLCGIDCLLGFVLCVSVHQAILMQAMPPFGIASALLTAAFAGFLLTGRGRNLPFGTLYAFVAPCLVCMTVLLAANVPPLSAACGTIALSASMFVAATNINWLNGVAFKYGFPIRAYVVMGRTAANIGRLIGIALGLSFVHLPPLAPSATQIVFVACVLLGFMLLSSRLPYFTGTPIDKGYVDEEFETMGDKASWSLNESFNARCNAVASEKGLTAREAELLKLLARGYNNVTISQILFLAPSTVKTHTYHIYKKLDVHTQQELIKQITPVDSKPDES